MKILASLTVLLALTISVGESVCCVVGDCYLDELPEAKVVHTTCGCCETRPEPRPAKPSCDCEDHDVQLSTPPYQVAFDNDLVAVLDPDTALVRAMFVLAAHAPEASTRPAAPHAGLTLPLLL